MVGLRAGGAIFCLTVFNLIVAFISPTKAVQKPDGKEVFINNRCSICHTVSAAGVVSKAKSGPDLTDVTVRHEKPWIRKFIRQNEGHVSCLKVDNSRDGKRHLLKFLGTPEEEDALIEWLDAQRSENKN